MSLTCLHATVQKRTGIARCILGGPTLTSGPVPQVYDITDKQTLQQVQNWVKELQAMVRLVRARLLYGVICILNAS